MKNNWQRKKITVDKLRIKYGLIIAFFLAVLLFIAWGHIFYIVLNILPNILSSEMAEELKGTMNTLVKVGVIYIIAVTALSIFLSNKIISPIKRIKKILLEIQETGNFDKDFTPKKSDELYDLLKCLNDTFQKLQEDRLMYRENRQEISEKIKDIVADMKDKATSKQLELLSEIEQIADKLKHSGVPQK